MECVCAGPSAIHIPDENWERHEISISYLEQLAIQHMNCLILEFSI